ncbi:MAG TPA: hypothetical protein VGN65_06990 [Casimicrobiaceae bacterium]|jgi:hypothetical protein
MSDETVRAWVSASGLSQANIDNVLAKPTRTDEVEFAGSQIRFYFRRIAHRDASSSALVIRVTPNGNGADIAAVVRFYDGLIPDAGRLSLPVILRQFAQRFCCDAHVGNVKKRIFLTEDVPITDAPVKESELGRWCGLLGAQRPGMQVVSPRIIVLNDNPWVARCVLFFGLNLSVYSAYAKRPPSGGT